MRNVYQDGKDAIKVMRLAYPETLNLNRMYGADYAKTEAEIAGKRQGYETEAINKTYGGFREAMLRSPEVAKANSAMLNRLDETGPSKIEKKLVADAESDLNLGGHLSDDELRNVQQASRAASSARGMGTGTSAALAEVLERDGAVRQRLRERQSFASGVSGQVEARKAGDASITANIGQAQMAYWDPQVRTVGKGGGSASLGAVSGPSSFSPFLAAAGDVSKSNQSAKLEYGMHKENLKWDKDAFAQNQEYSRWATAYNADQSNANAAAARKSNLTGAGIGALGMLAYAFL
jgi:hypothetical protein